MDLLSDVDLANAPEFLEFLKEQNLSEESLEYVDKETKRLFNEYVDKTNTVFNFCLDIANRNAAKGRNQENVAPPATLSKPNNSKRSIRNSNAKRGKSQTNRKLSKVKNYVAKHDVNNDLSQELEEKATVSSLPQEGKTEIVRDDELLLNHIPPGKVRIEVKSDVKAATKSPHEGEIRLVEPKANAAQQCKIGRSTGKEYSENGVSLHLDLEVSTKHGLLTRSNSSKNGFEYFYTDVQSTNGTFFVATGVRLTENEKYKLTNGVELRMGQSILQFNFSS